MFSKALCRLQVRGYPHYRSARRLCTVPRVVNPNVEEHLYVSSPVQDIQPVVGVTMPEYIRANMKGWGNKPAFNCFETGRKYNHNQVIEQSRGFGAALITAGFKPGDVIAVVAHNIPEYMAILLGIWEAGLVATTINWAYTPYEIERQLLISKARAVVTLPEYLPAVRKAMDSSPEQNFVVVVGEPREGCHTYFEMAKTDTSGMDFCSGDRIDALNDTAILLFSSGTTGPPKGVMLTHSNIVTGYGVQIRHPSVELGLQECTETFQERAVGVLPCFHMSGIWVGLETLLYGGYQLVLPKFDSSSYIQSIKELKPTTMFCAPPLLGLLSQHPGVGREDFEEVKAVMLGAAPSGPELINPMLEKFGDHVLYQEAYGMTETTTGTTVVPLHTKNRKVGSAGVPIPGAKTKILDPSSGKALGRNLPGEVCIKGPHIMKGYLNNEEATRNTIDPEGWCHTGDIGYYDDEGYLYIVDRLKELIKVNAFQVAPSELEDILRAHPKVADVAVCGVPDPRTGEAPRGYIVPKPGVDLKEEEILHFMKDKVAGFKQLKGVEFIPAIPKSPSGKILRRELLASYKTRMGLSTKQ